MKGSSGEIVKEYKVASFEQAARAMITDPSLWITEGPIGGTDPVSGRVLFGTQNGRFVSRWEWFPDTGIMRVWFR